MEYMPFDVWMKVSYAMSTGNLVYAYNNGNSSVRHTLTMRLKFL
jgi:hypothetical protein